MEEVLRGTCASCGKAYRVPRAGSAYRCKACGGTVRAERDGAARPAADTGSRRASARSSGGSAPPRPRPGRTRASASATVAGRARGARKSKTGFVVAALGIALVAAAVLVYFRFQHRTPLDSVLEDFAAAWNADGPSGAVEFLFPEDHASVRAGLEVEVEVARRAWGDGAHPRITNWSLGAASGEDDAPRFAVLALDGSGAEPLQTSWQLAGNRWRLAELGLPIGSLPERFVEAWNADDVEAVAAFFDDPEEAQGSLGRLRDRRAWSAFPRIESFRTTGGTVSSVTTLGATAEGELEIVWGDDPYWQVRGIRTPGR